MEGQVAAKLTVQIDIMKEMKVCLFYIITSLYLVACSNQSSRHIATMCLAGVKLKF